MPLSKRNSVDKAKLLKISLKAKIMGNSSNDYYVELIKLNLKAQSKSPVLPCFKCYGPSQLSIAEGWLKCTFI